MLHNTSKIIQGATESWFVNYHCSLYIGRPLDASENVFVFMFGLAVFGAIQDYSRKSVWHLQIMIINECSDYHCKMCNPQICSPLFWDLFLITLLLIKNIADSLLQCAQNEMSQLSMAVCPTNYTLSCIYAERNENNHPIATCNNLPLSY